MKLLQRICVISALFFLGCSGNQAKGDNKPTEGQLEGGVDPVDLDAVDSAALESAPCGNPDWSRLPGTKTDEKSD